MTPLVALAAVAAWLAAFQLAVSTLAYPTLLEQPADRFAAFFIFLVFIEQENAVPVRPARIAVCPRKTVLR